VGAIERRRSVREYSPQPISLLELSFLLWATQGVQEITDRPATLRPVPSAGARHAFETYLLINRVSDLQPGLYRYAAFEHALIELDLAAQTATGIASACRNSQPLCAASAVTFLWVAVAERMTWKYSERGYRYLFLDAGHVCQNLYLAADRVSCGVCALGGFNDNDLNRLLGLDGKELFVI
jgi:SagB-type dehydrogenase family enzyme